MTYVLAIDVGGTKSAVGIVDNGGRVIAQVRRPAHAERGPGAMIADYIEMAEEVLRTFDLRRDEITAVGVGCGGPLDPRTGVIYSPANLPGWDKIPLASRLQEALGLPVYVHNDANAAALAEYRWGAGAGLDSVIYLTISTGIGGGIVLDGVLYEGATGNAGELGHIIIRPGGRLCGCGGRGCLEAYCSGTSIAARAVEAAARHPESALDRLGRPPRAEDVVALAAEGDPVATELWAETIDLLAAGLATIVHAFDPRRIVLGGGVTRAGDAIFVPLREAVRALVMPHFRPRIDIVPAALGDEVGLIGAAAVALAGREPVTRDG